MVLRLISLVAQSSGIPSSLSAKRRVGEAPCRPTAMSAYRRVGEPRVGEPPSAKRRVGELSIILWRYTTYGIAFEILFTPCRLFAVSANRRVGQSPSANRRVVIMSCSLSNIMKYYVMQSWKSKSAKNCMIAWYSCLYWQVNLITHYFHW